MYLRNIRRTTVHLSDQVQVQILVTGWRETVLR